MAGKHMLILRHLKKNGKYTTHPIPETEHPQRTADQWLWKVKTELPKYVGPFSIDGNLKKFEDQKVSRV